VNVHARQPADGLAETVLIVPGMHCAGCMGKVERGLAEVSGVDAARVNLSARQVTVRHRPDLTGRDLVAALDAIGFESQLRRGALAKSESAARPLLAPLAVAGFAAMNVMLLSVGVWSGAEGATRELFHWLSAAIGIPAIAYAGQPFFRSAWGALRRRRTNMDVPISIGVLIATGLSAYEVVVGGRHAWFDGALMLLTFLLAGRVLDAMMRDRARSGVDALLSHVGHGATVVAADGTLGWQATDALAPGTVMRVAAGERLAADGVIVSGGSRFDQSLLTGESAPVSAGNGDLVMAGTLNLDDPVDVRVVAAGEDTTVAEIARLMQASAQDRSKYVRIADRASRLYAPAVHTLAALTLVGWLLAGAGLYKALVIAVAVLIITCPCALGLAVPVAQVVASGALMRAGVMVKDGSALERMATVDYALLDKTGTLTLGSPAPDKAVLSAMPAHAREVALALASHSRHPISRALAAALSAQGVKAAPLVDVTERAGNGVFATWTDRPGAPRAVSLRRPDAASGIAVSLDIAGDPAWLIPLADPLRPDAREALARMKALGIQCQILSGDNAAAVRDVARQTGLFGQAAASPADKQDAIARLQAMGRSVLMAGDGLNDGPALSKADASIAPGTASDVGLQASDLVFVQPSLLAVPRAVLASRRTMRVVRQNFALAIGYNVLAVPLAMAGFVTPMIAAIAMSVSSVIVIGNSLRLNRATRLPRLAQARGQKAA